MFYTGTFQRVLDEKLRIAIPKRLRNTESASNGVFYIAPGTDGSLFIYPEEAFARLSRRLASAPPTQQDVRAFSRLFYAQAELAELDRQGRLRVPPRLAEMARLGKDVVMLGVQDHFELWDRQRWETYREKQAEHYDTIAEAAFDHSQPAIEDLRKTE